MNAPTNKLLRIVNIWISLMDPHVELLDRVENAIFDSQMTSGFQNLKTVQHRQDVAGILESQSAVNSLNFVGEIFLK